MLMDAAYNIFWHILLCTSKQTYIGTSALTFSINWPTPKAGSFDLVLRPTGASIVAEAVAGTIVGQQAIGDD